VIAGSPPAAREAVAEIVGTSEPWGAARVAPARRDRRLDAASGSVEAVRGGSGAPQSGQLERSGSTSAQQRSQRIFNGTPAQS
jgi:hypothetical protein